MDEKPKRTPSLEKAFPFSSVKNWKDFGVFLLFSKFYFIFSFLSFCACWFVSHVMGRSRSSGKKLLKIKF
jgi:hypothetical protein